MKELLITSLLGIGVLAFDIFRMRKMVLGLILAAFAVLIGFIVYDWNNLNLPFNQSMLIYDNFAYLALGVFAVIAFFWFILSSAYFKNHEGKTDLYLSLIHI